MKNTGKILILILMILFVSGYAFTQALQVPLNSRSAGMVLQAWNMLTGKVQLSGWSYHPAELPVYLTCVKIFGPGTFAAIAADMFFFLLLFCTGLLILRSRGSLSALSLLIWAAVTGLPDPSEMKAIQAAPFLLLSLLIFPHFLSTFLEKNTRRDAAGSLLSGGLLFYSAAFLPQRETAGKALHETVRSLQTVFRADFSRQPLLAYATGRYFLMTLVIILMLWAVGRAFFRCIRYGSRHYAEIFYAAAIAVTLLICCLPGSGNREQKAELLAWLPFGTAVLLIFLREEPEISRLRFAGQKLSLNALVTVLAVITILFGFSPIVRSRPVSPADQVVMRLNEHGMKQGSCDPEDAALFTVAAKGQISFSADPDGPEMAFRISKSEPESAGSCPDEAVFGPYSICLMSSRPNGAEHE